LKGLRKSYLLRINEDLWNELNQWAEQEFRSLNGQIELILQHAVEQRRRGKKNESGPSRETGLNDPHSTREK
jgi:hypothetical protein